MIHLTENAATHISNYLQNRGKGEGIRIGVKTSDWLMYLSLLMISTRMTKYLNNSALKSSLTLKA